MNLNNKRNAGLDLLRVLLMIMICYHHVFVYGEQLYSGTEICLNNKPLLFLNSFFIIAANCFFLVSGYFLINLNIKKIVRISLYCILSIVLWNIATIIYNDQILDFSYSFVVFRRIASYFSCHWYIFCYFMLMLLSPFINKTLDNLNKKECQLLCLLLLVINVVYGFVYEYSEIGDGYTVHQAIMLYVIGHAIKINQIKINKFICLLGYLICSLITYMAALYVCNYGNSISCSWLFQYNNPLIISSSIFLFIFFSLLKNENYLLNKISVLANYSIFIILISDYSEAYEIIWTQYSHLIKLLGNKTLGIIIYGIILFVFSIIVGFIIVKICNLIEKAIYHIIDRKINN